MARNPYYAGPPTDHFDGERFFAPGGSRDKTMGDLLRWAVSRYPRGAWPTHFPGGQDRPPPRVAGEALRISTIGHASFLIQTQNVNLLVDPVWSPRASPFRFAGPKRVNAPGVALEDLPALDAILLTHNHYDHMDRDTLARLATLRPCPVLTLLGNDTILRAMDRHIVARAYDWGDSEEIGPLRVHFEPALHWSARRLGDKRMALWGAFVIATPAGKILYIGDTAYGDGSLFRDIGRRHGPMRLAILPIGAYAPRWFMRAHHIDPDEAVRIFRDVEAAQAIGHHWGVFRLTDEAVDDPPKRLAAALAQAGVQPRRFRAVRPGDVVADA